MNGRAISCKLAAIFHVGYQEEALVPSPGARVGSYKIVASIGAGGMGVVYRATDTKLSRDVALKFLSEEFSSNPERMARFQREALLLASLNHPNIATVYGLEDSGPLRALVMELVEGPTLADRIAEGPIPPDEVLLVAKQIAEALEYAHEHGVIHRDLKPANIKLKEDSKVKVLDFGLAKALSEETPASNLSNSPTLSFAATQAGIILGTAAYMSPEQAKGKTADRRADIWAFGVVVYEMLTGKMLFTGETVPETLAFVMTRDPDWNALPSSTPPRLRDLLRRCLTRDPRNRLRDIGDARVALEEMIAKPEAEVVAQPPSTSQAAKGRSTVPWIVAAAALLGAALAVWAPWKSPPAPPQVMRFSAELGADASLVSDQGSSAVLSPDGKMIAFVARPSATGAQRIYVRRLDQLNATALAGTEGARNPFFKPDSLWIGFFASGKVKKISVTGGAAVNVADAPDDRGGAWTEDGWIIFTPIGTAGYSLQRVPDAGGTPEPFTALDQASNEVTHRWPHVLPGGRGVLFTASTITGNYDAAYVAVRTPSGEKRILQRGGSYGRYLSSGHLVYVNQGTLFAAPFDLDRLEVTGPPVPALEGVTSNLTNGGAQFSFSESGSLVFLPGANVGTGWSLDWMDRNGKTQPLRSMQAIYANIRFSPDGRRMAMQILDQQDDIWTYDWARDTSSKLTFDPLFDRYPVWTPDGRRITLSSQRDKTPGNLYSHGADGTGGVQRLTESKNQQYPMSWHRSGKVLAFVENRPQTSWDILTLP
ncbi:MAG: serine/threonine-protein kinase, partial [Acidobacteria bacterium]|nr:serine/threonine-protein kinase [Acidobacteriota bacterium]